MKKEYSCMLLVLVILIIIFGEGIAGEITRDVVRRTALNDLPNILQRLPRQEIGNYGFRSPQELNQVSIGIPLEIFTVPPDALMAYSGTSFGSLLRTTGEWYVPVLVQEEYRVLLTVTQVQNKWCVVGISAAGLAHELGAFNQQLPTLFDSAVTQQTEEPKFVRIFQAYSDFMYLSTVTQEYLIPFNSARTVLELAPDKLLTPEVVIPLLKVEIHQD